MSDKWMKGARPRRAWWVLLAAFVAGSLAEVDAQQEMEIFAARYGTVSDFPLNGLLPDAPAGDVIDIALAIWVIRSGERTILFDSGFFREAWMDQFDVREYVRPDRLLERIGVSPSDVTDIVVSHAHWDHMGGLELFPNAVVWIQDEEFAYYTGAAWQSGGSQGGIDPADITHLVARNIAGSVRLIAGDGVEILPGIKVFTGARHTYASQYLLVEASPRFILASDNAYLFRNVAEGRPSATFQPDDREANIDAVARMIDLAGSPDRVIPGHDTEVFQRFPEVAEGIVRINP